MTTERNTTEEGAEEVSDKELNFAKLKEQHAAETEQLEAELNDLRPLRNKERVREAGFDPDSDRGKSLIIAIKAGEVEADPAQIKEFASETFGWESTPALTETEQAAKAGQSRVEAARAETSSETPPDLDSQIAEAEAAGEWGKAGTLKLQRMGAGT